MKKLVISPRQNFGMHIEERIEEDNLFFHEYETAAKKLNNIWEIQKGLHKDTKQRGICEYPNNIIAFCGERGSGKSSVMMSFMKVLENCGTRQDKFDFNDEIRNNNWSTQIMIDPSIFDGVHNIVDIVLAHIYSNFHEAYNQDNQRIDQYERQEMLRLLSKTYKSLSIIKNKEKMLDDEYDVAGNISKLQNLGESVQLRNSLEQLISRYLETISKLENRRSQNSEKLLIAIDDLDLCSEHAYEMAEQIRKYLILPNVIIFMAIRIQQLEMGVEEKNRADYRNILAGRKGDAILDQEMQDMAERYVTKLVPKARRIHLPKLESSQINLVLETGLQSQTENSNRVAGTIEKRVLRLIRGRTGMILMEMQNRKNYFVPENLRELVNLILLLGGMKRPNGSDQIRLENLYDFHSYFVEEMLKKGINGKRLAEFLEAVSSDDHLINYNVGTYIDGLLADKKKETDVYGTLSYEFPNTSLASIVDKLNVASGYLTRKEDYQLFCYIRMYYTILLNESLVDNGKIPVALSGGFIWGNMLNNIMPAVMQNNQFLLRRELFFIDILETWNTIADTLNKNEKLGFNVEKKNNSGKNTTQVYVTGIKESNKLPEVMCWLLLALFSSSSGFSNNGKQYITKSNLVYANHSVLPTIAVSLDNYFSNLNSLEDLYWSVNLDCLGVGWNEFIDICSAMENENKERIRQAKVIAANLELSENLLAYCRTNSDPKSASSDRTYSLVRRFCNNVKNYMVSLGMEDVDWTKFWIPTGIDEQGNVYGTEIDICLLYANICNREEEIIRNQDLQGGFSNVNEPENIILKRKFSKQVSIISFSDYTGEIATIPGYLINKTAKHAKEKLENIANAIQRYTYREKKFPEGFTADRIIKLYSEVVDLYFNNPDSKISASQSNEYKEVAKIKDIIL